MYRCARSRETVAPGTPRCGQEALISPCLSLDAPELHPTTQVPEGCPSAQQRHRTPSTLEDFEVHSKGMTSMCTAQHGHRAKHC